MLQVCNQEGVVLFFTEKVGLVWYVSAGADLGGFLRFPETGQVYLSNQNYILH